MMKERSNRPIRRRTVSCSSQAIDQGLHLTSSAWVRRHKSSGRVLIFSECKTENKTEDVMVLSPWIPIVVLIVFSVIFPGSLSSIPLSPEYESDRFALLAFKSLITRDPLGALSSWNESTNLCEWFGVACGRRHQRVIAVNLTSRRLVGSLGPHVGDLSFLKILDLGNNSFSGALPQELGHLHRLETLLLRNNSFSGEIPISISRCSNLQYLGVGFNNLTGKLPAELGLLSKLEKFTFPKNNISGEIPHSLGNCSSLVVLSGAINNLHGAIPTSLGRLKKLSILALANNYLTGTIPSSIYNLSVLTVLSLTGNRLKGTLNPYLGLLLPILEILELGTNSFTGTIPPTISNASNLREIQLPTNRLSGKVPSLAGLNHLVELSFSENNLGNTRYDDLNFLYYLVNCSELEILEFSLNNFGGMLPEYLSNYSTRLSRLLIEDNQIRGHIPYGIGNLIGLEVLGMGGNQLTGSIPSSLGALPILDSFSLATNDLSGNIPSSLGNLTSLSIMYLDFNNLNGSIPTSIGKLRNLVKLNLAYNRLTGAIPSEVTSMRSLSIYLDLSNNQLTGPIPYEIGQLVSLSTLDLDNNSLSGEIPRALGSCISLEIIDLSGNSLQGPIPESLSSLRAIQDLDLSRNNMSGKIPHFLGDLKLLKNLNLSLNDFEGEVPIQGAFTNASMVSLQGNTKLCGGISLLNLPRCASARSKGHKSSTKLKIVVGISSGMFILGLIFLFSFLLFYRSRKSRKEVGSMLSMGTSFPRITYGDIFKATNGFSSSNLIGKGGFGSVFKGFLNIDGTETAVAVKVLDLQRKGALKSFVSECEALRSVKHRNLVTTLSVCSGIDFAGHDFKALVYQYMVNGSLEEWLHPLQIQDSSQEHQPQHLDVIQRLNISIDVANAVDYLHNQCPWPIVHRDLKPSNVLLDGDMTAYVADFGLARLIPEAFDHQSSNQASSAGFKGSIGYVAPEYAMGGEVSASGDIYSYGILLLEMFTGKSPTDEMFKDGLNLRDHVEAAFPDEALKVVDPILLQGREVTKMNPSSSREQSNSIGDHDQQKLVECLNSIFAIGVACSVEIPRNRMSIADLLLHLRKTRDKFLKAGARH